MTPFLMPRGSPEIPKTNPERRKIWTNWAQDPTLTRDESFHEATGEVGDVYLLQVCHNPLWSRIILLTPRSKQFSSGKRHRVPV